MNELSRLKFRCRRGMKELDVIFARYLEQHYPHADANEKQHLNELLDLQDPVLYGMMVQTDPIPERYQALIEKLAQY